jgi:hypothetical protein
VWVKASAVPVPWIKLALGLTLLLDLVPVSVFYFVMATVIVNVTV